MHFYYLSAEGIPMALKARLSGKSRSSFYYKPKMPERNEILYALIHPIHISNPFYGPKRISNHLLEEDGLHINHKCVQRIMTLYDMRPKTSRKKRSKNQYTSGKPSLPNLVKDMGVKQPDLVWAGDFTKLRFQGRTYYFATVMDTCTREILGWHIATHHSVDLVTEALSMAIRSRKKAPRIFHSDHGSEYISETYVQELRGHGITPSNAAKGKPWQNGKQESFYNRFKEELGDLNDLPGVERLWERIGQQLHHYNTRRIHSQLRKSPRKYYLQKMKEHAALKKAT